MLYRITRRANAKGGHLTVPESIIAYIESTYPDARYEPIVHPNGDVHFKRHRTDPTLPLSYGDLPAPSGGPVAGGRPNDDPTAS